MKRNHRLLVLIMAALLNVPTSALAQDIGMSALFTSAQSDSGTTSTVPSEKGWASDANSSPLETKGASDSNATDKSSEDSKTAISSSEETSTNVEPQVGNKTEAADRKKQKYAKNRKTVAAKSDADSDTKADAPSDSKKSKSDKKSASKSKKSKSDAKDKNADASSDSSKSDSDKKGKKAEDFSDAKMSDSDDKDKNAENEPKVKKASKKSDVSWPTRLTSFACCSFLGLPIAMAKSGYRQTLAGNKDLIGESKNPIKLLISTSLSLPFAMAGGFLEGSGYSVINSWKGSAEEPFGREAFSLEDAKPAAQDTPPQEK